MSEETPTELTPNNNGGTIVLGVILLFVIMAIYTIVYAKSCSQHENNIKNTNIDTLKSCCACSTGYLGGFDDQTMPIRNDLRWKGTVLNAGNIRPAYLFPHRPFGCRMGLA